MTTLDTSVTPDYAGLGSLDGQAVIVAGAGNGIGRQTAFALASLGARVVCADIDADRAEAVAAEVNGVPVAADLCERDGVDHVLKQATTAGSRLGGIVDIIGISAFRTVAETDDELWESSHRLNFRHAVLLSQQGGAALAEAGGGALVYIASLSGIFAAQRHAAYGAHKAALLSLVRSSAVELGPSGVRVNAVAPGVIWTDRIGGAIGEEGYEAFTEGVPLERLGVPSDIATVAAFLASGWSAYVNGQTIIVDGGRSVRFPYPVETL